MLRGLLSRFSLRYPVVLTYMLQSSEYYISDYIEWLHKVSDFNKVERAGRLKYTKKAIIVLVFIWTIYVASAVKVVLFALALSPLFGYFPLALVLLLPFLLPYLAIIPVLVLKYFIQVPLEITISKKLKKRISAHPAVKIAIAGSFGKTTMREILVTVIGEGKRVSAPTGSINTLWGINSFMNRLKGDEEVLIFELGEYYPGDVRRLAEIVQPDMGVITGINEAHLKRFKSINKTVATIYELVDSLGDKPVYINGDNELAAENTKGNFRLYGSRGVGKWKVGGENSDLSGTGFVLSNGDKKLKLHSDLLGLHLVGPLAAAVDIALSVGVSTDEAILGVAATKPFPRRLERTTMDEDIVVLDDSYNGNPDGVRAVINFLNSIKGYRRFYVTSGLVEMGHKNEAVHLDIAKQLVDAEIEKVILVRNSSTEIIFEGLRKYKYSGEIIWYHTMIEAKSALPNLLAKGDLVLLQTDWPDQYR